MNRTRFRARVSVLRRAPVGSLVVIIAFVLVALLCPVLAPYNPNAQGLANALAPPNLHHLFGTDELGRDMLSRVLYGTRPLAIVVSLSVALGATVGSLYGMLAGAVGGLVELLLMRLVDIMLSIPAIVIAVLLATIFGAGETSAIVAITLVLWPQFARVARADTVTVIRGDYCQLARVAGLGELGLLRRHVIPNISNNICVLVTLSAGVAVLVSTALSFLGLGIEPPAADWGSMLADASQYLSAWWLIVFPGAALAGVIMAFNAVGDWLRDVLDPHRKARRVTVLSTFALPPTWAPSQVSLAGGRGEAADYE